MQLQFIIKVFGRVILILSYTAGLIRLDWETLSMEVTLRYFSSENYYASSDPQEIWEQMGENITCTVDQDMVVTVTPPSGFDAAKPIKSLTHGFMDTMINDNTQFVSGRLTSY